MSKCQCVYDLNDDKTTDPVSAYVTIITNFRHVETTEVNETNLLYKTRQLKA